MQSTIKPGKTSNEKPKNIEDKTQRIKKPTYKLSILKAPRKDNKVGAYLGRGFQRQGGGLPWKRPRPFPWFPPAQPPTQVCAEFCRTGPNAKVLLQPTFKGRGRGGDSHAKGEHE